MFFCFSTMKLIHKNIKKGDIKVKIENLEDLWYLSNIIDGGDVIKGKTARKISYGGKEGKSRVEKKIIFLSISRMSLFHIVIPRILTVGKNSSIH